MKRETPYAFFRRCAGYSYGAGETKEQGRSRCARALAEAEAQGCARLWCAHWSEDTDPDRSWMDQEGYTAEDRESAEFYVCDLRDDSGQLLGSLCGIHEDIRSPKHSREYRRVVRAELMLEALQGADAPASALIPEAR